MGQAEDLGKKKLFFPDMIVSQSLGLNIIS